MHVKEITRKDEHLDEERKPKVAVPVGTGRNSHCLLRPASIGAEIPRCRIGEDNAIQQNWNDKAVVDRTNGTTR